MTTSPSTRARMLDAAVDGLRRHGVAGMSFTDVLAASGAARGAIYHHFPGGKAQLVAEAARANAGQVRHVFASLPADTPGAVVDGFVEAVRPAVAGSSAGLGCAVAALSLDDDRGNYTLRRAASTAFESWTNALAERLSTAGLPTSEATDLATTLLAMLEGAHILCRAAGSLEPYERIARTARTLV